MTISEDRIEWKPTLLLLFAVLQILDVISTNRVLAAGGWEANPAMVAAQAHLGAWWWLPKLTGMGVVALVMARWPLRFVAIATGVMGLVVVNNLSQ